MKANLSILVGLFCCLSLSSFKIENLHKGFSLVSQKENLPPKESFPSDPKKPSDESLFIKRRSEEKVIDISSDLENNEKEIDLETPSNNEEEKATSVLENKNGEIDQDTSKALENNEKKKASSNLKGREACIAQPCIECKSSTPLLRYIESTDAPTPAGPFSQGVIFNSSKGIYCLWLGNYLLILN